jgi:predicted amidohydrolase
MDHEVSIAVVQMDAQPALVSERLRRAEKFVSCAAEEGAQLVLLPELFNTGYEYHEDNYYKAERIDGLTVNWMKSTANKKNIFLAGTMLLFENGDIYNSMFLIAPDGETWRYDKNYPWIWERAYFKGGSGIKIAQTKLGRFGMMVCWDVAHCELWAKYAGKVDAMLISSCPPAVHNLTLVFPDGNTLNSRDAGFLMRRMQNNGQDTFDTLLRRQSAYFQIPLAIATGTGLFSTRVPLPIISLSPYLISHPAYWDYFSQVRSIKVETDYFQNTYIADRHGAILAKVKPDEEGYVVQKIILLDNPALIQGIQPSYGLSHLLYWTDNFAQAVLSLEYNKKLKALR